MSVKRRLRNIIVIVFNSNNNNNGISNTEVFLLLNFREKTIAFNKM